MRISFRINVAMGVGVPPIQAVVHRWLHKPFDYLVIFSPDESETSGEVYYYGKVARSRLIKN